MINIVNLTHLPPYRSCVNGALSLSENSSSLSPGGGWPNERCLKADIVVFNRDYLTDTVFDSLIGYKLEIISNKLLAYFVKFFYLKFVFFLSRHFFEAICSPRAPRLFFNNKLKSAFLQSTPFAQQIEVKWNMLYLETVYSIHIERQKI